MRSMRSPIRWFGGKGNFTQHLLPLIPEHHCYCEVFGGGASLLFAKPLSKVEVYNDLDGDVVAFFRLFHDPEAFKEFRRKCHYTPFAQDWYTEARTTWENQDDPIERAYRWFVVARMCRNGSFGHSSITFSHQRDRAGWFKQIVDDMDRVVERLRSVNIENRDWAEIFRRYDAPHTVFYLDPPYLPSTRSSAKYYRCEMTEDDHIGLIDALKSIKGKVILSGYRSELYDSLQWERKEVELENLHGKTKTECLWRNYEIQPTLF